MNYVLINKGDTTITCYDSNGIGKTLRSGESTIIDKLPQAMYGLIAYTADANGRGIDKIDISLENAKEEEKRLQMIIEESKKLTTEKSESVKEIKNVSDNISKLKKQIKDNK